MNSSILTNRTNLFRTFLKKQQSISNHQTATPQRPKSPKTHCESLTTKPRHPNVGTRVPPYSNPSPSNAHLPHQAFCFVECSYFATPHNRPTVVLTPVTMGAALRMPRRCGGPIRDRVLEGEYGRRNISLAIPIILGLVGGYLLWYDSGKEEGLLIVSPKQL